MNLALASPELSGLPDGRVAELRARVTRRLALHMGRVPATLRNAGPLASFTFDDVPQSAQTAGAPMLEAAGIAGTFYVSAGLLGQRTRHWRVLDADGVRALAGAGHEIGCHGFSHLRAADIDRATLVAEMARNRAALDAVQPGLALDNFAYPYGCGSVAAKRAFAGRFASSRGIVPALNAGRVDRQMLGAFPLVDAETDRAAIDRVLDEAAARNAWAIFYTHDVADAPSPYGCTPGLLAQAIEAVQRRGIAPVTVARGLALAGVERGA